MTRTQQQAAALGVLAVLIIVVYARALRAPTPAGHGGSDAPLQQHEAASASTGAAPEASSETRAADLPPHQSGEPALRAQQRERAALLGWGRDPFTRGGLSGQASGLILSGILWDAAHPMAIINGSMVHVGDDLDGYRIEAINQDHVSMTDGAQTFRLDITP